MITLGHQESDTGPLWSSCLFLNGLMVIVFFFFGRIINKDLKSFLLSKSRSQAKIFCVKFFHVTLYVCLLIAYMYHLSQG